MENLEKLNIPTNEMSFEPATSIFFIMNGAHVSVETPLSIKDFTLIWKTKKRRIKIITGKNTYACIDKRHVDFYQVFAKK